MDMISSSMHAVDGGDRMLFLRSRIPQFGITKLRARKSVYYIYTSFSVQLTGKYILWELQGEFYFYHLDIIIIVVIIIIPLLFACREVIDYWHK